MQCSGNLACVCVYVFVSVQKNLVVCHVRQWHDPLIFENMQGGKQITKREFKEQKSQMPRLSVVKTRASEQAQEEKRRVWATNGTPIKAPNKNGQTAKRTSKGETCARPVSPSFISRRQRWRNDEQTNRLRKTKQERQEPKREREKLWANKLPGKKYNSLCQKPGQRRTERKSKPLKPQNRSTLPKSV